MSEENTKGEIKAEGEGITTHKVGGAHANTHAESSSTDTPTTLKVSIPAKFKDIVSKIEEMSVLDLHELVKILEEKFGVSAAAVAVAGPAAGNAEVAEEKSAFNVELTASGEQKIAVMKVVKEVLALGLKEAKDLVDGAPSMLKEGMKKVEAEEFKKKLEAAGAKVTLK
jgi:large subunit ribosomal protein L7/L12